MSENLSKKYNPSSAFDDRSLPENNISRERMIEIDKLAEPYLKEAMAKLRKEKSQSLKGNNEAILDKN